MKKDTFIKKIVFENFKCYEKTEVMFKDLCIIVGENNAGKSCLVEGLRLISTAAQQSVRKTFKKLPSCFEQPLFKVGFEIDTKKLKIDMKTIVYFYDKPYAKITAYFQNENKIEIFANKDVVYAVLYNRKEVIKSKSAAQKAIFNKIAILPQIGLIRTNEKQISENTIVLDQDTYLTSLHFRNELWYNRNLYFKDFKQLAENTWPGLRIRDLSKDDIITLFVQDNNFTSEIGSMGSGIKMWLQIMWFLVRTRDYDVVILDEPDIYMHPDLQSKLLDIVKSRYKQVIIATHSTEIISRVDAENILSINKKDKKLKYATDSQVVQNIIDNIGGMQNLSLIRLGLSRKCLFVEGEDLSILNGFNEIIYGKRLNIPTISYGGYSKINYCYGASKLLYSESNNSIKCIAIADRDYRDDESIKNKIYEAQNENLDLHIWAKKEIENYLVNPKVLYRLVNNQSKEEDTFRQDLEKIVDEFHDEVFDKISNEFSINYKDKKERANIYARDLLKIKWTTLENKISLVNGKMLLAQIRKYYKEKFNITLTNHMIFKNFQISDIEKEMVDMLNKLQ